MVLEGWLPNGSPRCAESIWPVNREPRFRVLWYAPQGATPKALPRVSGLSAPSILGQRAGCGGRPAGRSSVPVFLRSPRYRLADDGPVLGRLCPARVRQVDLVMAAHQMEPLRIDELVEPSDNWPLF